MDRAHVRRRYIVNPSQETAVFAWIITSLNARACSLRVSTGEKYSYKRGKKEALYDDHVP